MADIKEESATKPENPINRHLSVVGDPTSVSSTIPDRNFVESPTRLSGPQSHPFYRAPFVQTTNLKSLNFIGFRPQRRRLTWDREQWLRNSDNSYRPKLVVH